MCLRVKYGLPIYANEKRGKQLRRKIVKFNGSKFIFNHMKQKSIAGFDIESFNVSHDAIDAGLYFPQ